MTTDGVRGGYDAARRRAAATDGVLRRDELRRRAHGLGDDGDDSAHVPRHDPPVDRPPDMMARWAPPADGHATAGPVPGPENWAGASAGADELTAPPPAPATPGRRVAVAGIAAAFVLVAGGLGVVWALTSGGDGDRLTSTGDDTATIDLTGDGATDGSGAVPLGGAAASSAPAASAQGMVQVPAGRYTLGVDDPDVTAESSTRTHDGSSFWIDVHEVTNADWARFVVEAGAQPASSWPGDGPEPGLEDHPVVGVNHEWAGAYCASLGKRLPTEAEWEIAARGPNGLLWPWGDGRDAVELPGSGTYEVGSVAGNVSAFGVHDLTGNAWEWVAEPYDELNGGDRVLRGGQNGYLRNNASRLAVQRDSGTAVGVAGFRCAADAAATGVAPNEFDEVALPEAPMSPPPTAPPAGFLLDESFRDTTTGWLQGRAAGGYFGYHPNEYYHLDLTVPGERILALAPPVYSPAEPVVVGTTVFVEQDLTDPAGSFEYGLAVRHDGDRFLAFVVDPRLECWRVMQRKADGSEETLIDSGQAIPSPVTLQVRMEADHFEFVIGETTVSTLHIPEGVDGSGVGFVAMGNDEIVRAHVHYDEFWVRPWER
ncbi:MAG: SUMF1/EgtB/PvdO family nonheme iron enzyme [Actinomycetota bacterium]|nr:SUMF1/EgtB/PvdO family nonheme iron enzyme [Actinomycetota bacterium]